MTEIDINHLRAWIGRSQEKTDVITVRLVQSFNAIFGSVLDVGDGDEAPAGIHWCLAPDITAINSLGADGHPARGGFLPPIPLPRRMWAGGRLAFPGEFRIGDVVTKRSEIKDVVLKTGRTGPLIFVTVRHEYETSRGVVLTEQQDIVYREKETGEATAVKPASPEPLPAAEHTDIIIASPSLLFLYSAITFNSHRIHYDLDYVTKEEGYPGLIFHGPLQATYLLRLATALGDGSLPETFSFRSIAPLFVGGAVSIHAAQIPPRTLLWVADQTGRMTMTAATQNLIKDRDTRSTP